MNGKNSIGSIVGGSFISVVHGFTYNFQPQIEAEKIVETIVYAALGAIVGFFVQKFLNFVFNKKKIKSHT